MRIAIATVQVPFISGGAELMTLGLMSALREFGHQVEVVSMPFRFGPQSAVRASMDMWKAQDFTHFDCGRVDEVIALKFPAFYLRHANKKVWLMHQHRSVYELFDTQYGDRSEDSQSIALRHEIHASDTAALREAADVFTISRTVSDRLLAFNGIKSTPLYQPPPHAEKFLHGELFPYIFCPSRIESLKRQELLVRAMIHVRAPVVAVIAGDGGQLDSLVQLTHSLGVGHKVKFIGRPDHDAMVNYYRNCLAVFFGPLHEDYGFVTLEAMLSSKAVITCTDSGGPTEFVRHLETGHVVEPTPAAVADSIDSLWCNRKATHTMGHDGRRLYDTLGISWHRVVSRLLR
jgi:glycosyltransferase involved in cell wall biosynthesis